MDKDTKDAPKEAPTDQKKPPQTPAPRDSDPVRYSDWASI